MQRNAISLQAPETSSVTRMLTAAPMGQTNPKNDGGRRGAERPLRMGSSTAVMSVLGLLCFFANLRSISVGDVNQQGFLSVGNQPVHDERLKMITTEPTPHVVVGDVDDDVQNLKGRRKRLKIALIASFVPQPTKVNYTEFKDLDNVINKACYAYTWGYDFIFNTTNVFTAKDRRKAPWLYFGSWNRVPHLQSQLTNYDWMMYADLDHVIRDLSRPLESFLNEFRVYNQTPSIFVPTDLTAGTFFASYAVLIKNSTFSHRVLENWMEFGRGLCINGNFPIKKMRVNGLPKYIWEHSDQPGLWYGLMKTYEETYNTTNMKPICSPRTGYIDSTGGYGPEAIQYFRDINFISGHHGDQLTRMNGQPMIRSTNTTVEAMHVWGGLGMQMVTRRRANLGNRKHAFAYHEKFIIDYDFKIEVEKCKKVHGCYARFDEHQQLEIGCNGREFTVVQ